MSVMARCAATPRICEFANELAASTSVAVLDGDVVHEQLRRIRQHEARHAADDHQHEAEHQSASVFPDERARLFPRLGAQAFLLRRLWSGGCRSS
jgi:hypothetical protein